MKNTFLLEITLFFFVAGLGFCDSFGMGANQFEIDFVTISGDASSINGPIPALPIGYNFTDPGNYRICKFEVTNEQWNKFVNISGKPTGDLADAYDADSEFTGLNVPTNNISWLEAAQFVNWLNTSEGHPAAYKFTGTIGQNDYSFTNWDVTDAGFNPSNPYRNSNAFYFLPSESEWAKAAYWNGASLQSYATVDNTVPTAGVDTNFGDDEGQPWDVGSGSEELNGTFDMMGNLWEWLESPFYPDDYLADSFRGIHGGAYYLNDIYIRSNYRNKNYSYAENNERGFRVASVVPEPATLLLFGLGGLGLRHRRK